MLEPVFAKTTSTPSEVYTLEYCSWWLQTIWTYESKWIIAQVGLDLFQTTTDKSEYIEIEIELVSSASG